MSDLVSLVAVAVSARTGTDGNKFVRRPIFANAGLNADLGIEKKLLVNCSIMQHLIWSGIIYETRMITESFSAPLPPKKIILDKFPYVHVHKDK